MQRTVSFSDNMAESGDSAIFFISLSNELISLHCSFRENTSYMYGREARPGTFGGQEPPQLYFLHPSLSFSKPSYIAKLTNILPVLLVKMALYCQWQYNHSQHIFTIQRITDNVIILVTIIVL